MMCLNYFEFKNHPTKFGYLGPNIYDYSHQLFGLVGFTAFFDELALLPSVMVAI